MAGGPPGCSPGLWSDCSPSAAAISFGRAAGASCSLEPPDSSSLVEEPGPLPVAMTALFIAMLSVLNRADAFEAELAAQLSGWRGWTLRRLRLWRDGSGPALIALGDDAASRAAR